MPTRWFLKPDGTLIHGHTNGRSDVVQWTTPDTFHRTDPDAHERENSWNYDPALWSRKNWDLTRGRRIELMREAYKAHERNRRLALGRYYEPDLSHSDPINIISNPDELSLFHRASAAPAPNPAVTAEAVTAEVEAEELERNDEPESTSETHDETAPRVEIVEESSELPHTLTGDSVIDNLSERISNMEELAITLAGPIEERLTSLESTKQRVDGEMRQIRADINNLPKFDASPLVARIEQLEAAKSREVTYTVNRDLQEYVSTGLRHKRFDLLLRATKNLRPNRRNIWLAGPAGGGKTTAAEQLAEALGLPYDFSGAIDSPYKISGYRTATGEYIDTAFRRMYEHGGVMLLDEVDGGDPRALLELNAALANDSASFPDKLVKRHENFICIAAANTWGYGADGNYVGRVKLDAAFLNRFIKLTWDYDEDLERLVAGDPQEWVDVVQSVRRDVFAATGAQMVISPRSTYFGCELLRGGDISNEEVVELVFGDYRKHSMWSRVGRAAEEFARTQAAPRTTPRLTQTVDAALTPNALNSVDFSRVR